MQMQRMTWTVLLVLIVFAPSSSTAVKALGVHKRDLAEDGEATGAVEFLKNFANEILDSRYEEVSRKVIQSGISPRCSLDLLKFTNALRELEPWAARLVDASGKYPSGLFHGTISDLGAFDECVETVMRDETGHEKLRAHYCNVFVKFHKNDTSLLDHFAPAMSYSHRLAPKFTRPQSVDRAEGARLGVCVSNNCKGDDLERLINTLIDYRAHVTVRDCVSNEPPLMTDTQAGIIAFLAVLGAIIVISSIIDYILPTEAESGSPRGTLVKCVTAFSAISNFRLLMDTTAKKDTDAHLFRFLHGMRFFTMVWIVLGQSYHALNTSITARLVNGLHYSDNVTFCVVTAAYFSVDTFLFIGGLMLTYNVLREKSNRFVVSCTAIVRRYIRGTVPAFFVIMFVYLVPLFALGPNVKEYYDQFQGDINRNWWSILLQIRNFTKELHIGPFGHLWYLSTDFQLFVVALTTLQVLSKKFWWSIGALVTFSLATCCVSAWQVLSKDYTPFMVPMTDTYSIFVDTLNELYVLPWYHAVAFFSGCITMMLIARYRTAKVSKIVQLGLWLVGVTCALTTVFIMYDWNRGEHPTEWAQGSVAFSQRLLWAIWLSWLTFACATGRGGFVEDFLSWEAFVPLSRLSFGVFLIQLPFYLFKFSIARDRLYYSHFVLLSQFFSVLIWCYLLSFLLYMVCEAPIGRLEKIMLRRSRPGDTLLTTEHGYITTKEKGDRDDGGDNGRSDMATASYL